MTIDRLHGTLRLERQRANSFCDNDRSCYLFVLFTKRSRFYKFYKSSVYFYIIFLSKINVVFDNSFPPRRTTISVSVIVTVTEISVGGSRNSRYLFNS